MSVSVPIKPKDKFGFTRSIPELKRPEEKSNTELQFLKDLADQGKIISRSERGTGANQRLAEFVIPNGSTFYLLKATAAAASDPGQATLEFPSGTAFEVADLPTGVEISFQSVGASFIGNGTNSISIFVELVANASVAVLYGYLEASKTRSSRGTTESS